MVRRVRRVRRAVSLAFVTGGVLSLVALAWASSALGGCGAFGTDEAPSADDAGSTIDAQGSTDADLDLDGAVQFDALTTAPDAGGTAILGCPPHQFCADFEGASPQEGFTAPVTDFGGRLALQPSTGRGHVLVATIPAKTNGSSTAYVGQNFTGSPPGFHAELDVFIPPTALIDFGDVAIFAITGTTGYAGVLVNLRNGTPNLDLFLAAGPGTGSPQTVPATLSLPIGQWTRLAVDLVYGTQGKIRVTIDGALAYDKPFVSKTPPLTALRVGLQRYGAATPDLSGMFDVVRADVIQSF